MTKLFTPRLGLVKPQPGTGEPQDVADLNSNADNIDKWAGAILVNDGVTPSTAELFDGAIVKEKTSGKVWVAQKNVGGTYDARYIRFPWQLNAFTTSVAVGTSAWGRYGLETYGGGSVAGGGSINSSAADIVGQFIILPAKAIYHIKFQVKWQLNASGIRSANINFNDTASAEDINTVNVSQANSVALATNQTTYTDMLPAGTKVSVNLNQNSGVTLNATIVATVSMIMPVQT